MRHDVPSRGISFSIIFHDPFHESKGKKKSSLQEVPLPLLALYFTDRKIEACRLDLCGR